MDRYQERQQLPKIRTVYPVLEPMLLRAGVRARQDAFSGETGAEFGGWREGAVRLLGELLGLSRMEPAPGAEAVTDEVVELEDHILREHLRIQTEPGVWLTAYILRPAGSHERTPVVLCPHGHKGYGKYSVAGCYEYPAVMEKIEHYHWDYGRRIARLGYVAVCPDMRGFGERKSRVEHTLALPEAIKCECTELTHMGAFLGITFLGMACWDLMRLVDYIVSRKGWDGEHIYVCGFSSGGMQALYLTALDERIRGALISGYLYGIRDSLIRMNENCSCNYVPHLLEHFDMGDIASMIAPRPLWIQSCREDRLNGHRGMENVYEQVEILRRVYDRLGAGERVYHEVCPGGHQFHPENLEEAMRFLEGSIVLQEDVPYEIRMHDCKDAHSARADLWTPRKSSGRG